MLGSNVSQPGRPGTLSYLLQTLCVCPPSPPNCVLEANTVSFFHQHTIPSQPGILFIYLLLYFVVKCTQYKMYHSDLLTYTIQWHLVSPECCASVTTAQFQNIFSTPKVTPYPLSCHSSMPLGHLFRPRSPVLAISHLLCVSMNLPILEISYNWNHTVCGLLSLASPTNKV